jgi:GT2 family glycosyltransferase
VTIGCVILTTGDRPEQLSAAVASVTAQHDVTVDTVVVWNRDGDDVPDLPGTRPVRPGRNLGIPEGRNVGAAALPDVDLLLFLDDDALLVGDDLLAEAARRFDAQPDLGVITMRIVDPDTGRTERRHVPRVRVGDPLRSSEVTTFLGGASIVRADAFRRAGGLPGHFRYAHEETSLAWRLLDLGYRIRYEADLVVHHPAAPPARHAEYHHLSARNRVLLVRMHLPWPVAVAHLAVWSVLTVLRAPGGLPAAAAGAWEGLRARDVDRHPIRWRTVLRMARYGRPPVL